MGTQRRPRFAVGLTGTHLVQLVADSGSPALERLDGLGAAFLALGTDRATGEPGRATLDPSVSAAALAAETATPLLVVGAPQRDHPYNLARRIASLDHLSGGRVGVLLAERDASAPLDAPGREAWGGARLSGGAPLGPETTRDAALVLRALWQSFPIDAIVADRETRVYADADRIVHIDHHGVFDVAGPLTVPTTPQGTPVLGWSVGTAAEAAAAVGLAELVVGTAELVPAEAAPLVYRPVRLEDAAGPDGGAWDGADLDGAHLLLLPDPGTPLDAVIRIARDLLDRGVVEPSTGSTLRERVGLGPALAVLEGARPAFARAPERRAS